MSREDRCLNLFLLLCMGCILTMAVFGFVVVRRSRVPAVSSSVEPKIDAPDLKLSTESRQRRTPASQSKSALQSRQPARSSAGNAPPAVVKDIAVKRGLKPRRVTGFLYFRTDSLNDTLGKLAVTSLDALDKVSYSDKMTCARVHFASGKGVCLTREAPTDAEKRSKIGFGFDSWFNPFSGYSAVVFDKRLRPGAWRIELKGLPSRVRVSPSGHLAAITVFLSGQSYAALRFSTQTTLVDIESGRVLADLEKFSVTRNGEAFRSPDFNFWGVTFSRDDNLFYATLWSAGKAYLVKCNLARQTAEVIYEGVECPSLSPDNTRIAFKKRTGWVGGPRTWQISLLDLRTLTAVPLSETRSVDDQVEWLDNQHILYALLNRDIARTDIWALNISPGSSPQLWLTGGSSPAAVPDTN